MNCRPTAVLALLVLACGGCSTFSPLVDASQKEAIRTRDATLKELMATRSEEILGGGILVLPRVDTASGAVFIPMSNMQDAATHDRLRELDDNAFVAIVRRSPVPVEPVYLTLGELKKEMSTKMLLEEAAANNLAMQSAVLDATKLGVVNAESQKANAEAITSLEKSIGEISVLSKASSGSVSSTQKTLEQGLVEIKAQLEQVKAKLNSL